MSLLNAGRGWAVMACCTLVWCIGCSEGNQLQEPPPPLVDVAQPVADQVRDFLEFTGTTQAVDTVDIRARINGYLKSIEFTDGAIVEAGDLLMVIEPEPFEAALAAAKAAVEKANATLKLAEAELERTRPLVKRGALPVQELDVKQADVATAAADVATATAALDRANLDIGYTEIRAPISGRIGRHLVDVGNLVQAETTSLATLESNSQIHAYFSASESDVLRLMEMARSEGKPDSSQIFLGLSSEEGYPHAGVLDFSEFGVNQSTGTQMRRAIFENKDQTLIPGLFVRLRLPIGSPADELLVAERAIGTDQRGDYLLSVNREDTDAKPEDYKYDDKTRDKVVHRPVKLGISVNGMRVVQSGVTKDDWIVINGLQRARPGSVVQTTALGMDGQPLPKKEEAAAPEAAAVTATTTDGGQ